MRGLVILMFWIKINFFTLRPKCKTFRSVMLLFFDPLVSVKKDLSINKTFAFIILVSIESTK